LTVSQLKSITAYNYEIAGTFCCTACIVVMSTVIGKSQLHVLCQQLYEKPTFIYTENDNLISHQQTLLNQ